MTSWSTVVKQPARADAKSLTLPSCAIRHEGVLSCFGNAQDATTKQNHIMRRTQCNKTYDSVGVGGGGNNSNSDKTGYEDNENNANSNASANAGRCLLAPALLCPGMQLVHARHRVDARKPNLRTIRVKGCGITLAFPFCI